MQTPYSSCVIIFIVIGFLATVDVHGQTCNDEYTRCNGLSERFFSNPDRLNCSSGYELKECVSILGSACASEPVGHPVWALRMTIEYVCSPQGLKDLEGFQRCTGTAAGESCAISYPQEVYGICWAAKLYSKCLGSDCNMEAENFYEQLASSRLAECESSTEQPGGDAVLCMQEYHRCLTLISNLRPEYNHSICSPGGQLTNCASSLRSKCSNERPNAAASIGLLITFTEYLCSDQGRADAGQYATCQGSAAACYQTFMTNVPSTGCRSALTVLEDCTRTSCDERVVQYISKLVRRPPGCQEETVTLPWGVSGAAISLPRPMVSAGPFSVPPGSSSTTTSGSSILLNKGQWILLGFAGVVLGFKMV